MFLPTQLYPRAEEQVSTGKPTDPHGLALEGWAQGYMVGSLVVISCITISNMKKDVLLHKLIFLELILGIWHGFWILLDPPVYEWWLSVSAIPLNASWVLHNVIAWIKIKPFLSPWASRLFIGTIILTIPYWVLEIYANFAFFHNVNTIFLRTRPFEALCRDPWWILTTIVLVYNIKVKYELRLLEVIRISPRFAVLLGAMFISIAFIVVDVLAVTNAFSSSLPVGINPFWKLAFVFKCLTDAVILDDFKTALTRLKNFKLRSTGCGGIGLPEEYGESQWNSNYETNDVERYGHTACSDPIGMDDVRADLEKHSPEEIAHRNNNSSRQAAQSRQTDRRTTISTDQDKSLEADHRGPSMEATSPVGPPEGWTLAPAPYDVRNSSSRIGMLNEPGPAGPEDTDTESGSTRTAGSIVDAPTRPRQIHARRPSTTETGAGAESHLNPFGTIHIEQVIPDIPLDGQSSSQSLPADRRGGPLPKSQPRR